MTYPTGRELDALVAEKVMGWSFCDGHGGYWSKGGLSMGSVHAWSPSTDIGAAWQVVEKLERDGILIWKLGREDHMPNWFVSMGRNHKPGVNAEEATAPIAICRAALAVAKEMESYA